MRFTPAGLPALDVTLKHESEVDLPPAPKRYLFLEMRAKAIGPITTALVAAELGAEHRFEGFLGSQRNGRGIVFHIQTFELK